MSKVEFYETNRRVVSEEGAVAEWTEHRWRVKASNGEIVAHGEGYPTESNARRGFRDAAGAVYDAWVELCNDVRPTGEPPAPKFLVGGDYTPYRPEGEDAS